MSGMDASPADLPTRFVTALTARLAHEPCVEAFWMEGDDDSVLWPPYRHLDLHVAVPEPFLADFRARWPGHLRAAGALDGWTDAPAPFKGFAGAASLPDGTALRARLERTSQLAKVPRRVVNVLLDRSGGLLRAALSFET